MTGTPHREPRIVSLYGMYIVGLEVRTTNRDETDPEIARIPVVWKRAIEENLAGKIPDATEPTITLGAYTRYQTDENGPYSLIVGAEVASLGDVPEGMAGITVLAQEYLIFSAVGEMPQAGIDAWVEVHRYFSETTSLTRSFTADFERYDSARPDEVEIYIAVR